MQKRSFELVVLIYGAAVLFGAFFSWTGITIVAVIYGICFLREFVKIPFLAPMTQHREAEYAGPLFLSFLLMLFLGFLSHSYGWQHIFAFLGQAFLRQ